MGCVWTDICPLQEVTSYDNEYICSRYMVVYVMVVDCNGFVTIEICSL